MSNFYEIGSLIRLSGTFSDSGNNPADPATITLRIRKPDGTVAVYTGDDIIKDSTGNFHYDFLVDQDGDHYYRYEGTGDVYAAAEALFHVRRSNVIGG